MKNRDITYCTGGDCKKKELCARYLNKCPDVTYSFMNPPFVQKLSGQSCDFFKRKTND